MHLTNSMIFRLEATPDYYPFGMSMPGRSLELSNYRFGFNTQEKVDEISGNGNHNTALFWEYDTRLGRRWNLDPKPTVGLSDYATFANNPIWLTDVMGDKVSLDKSVSENKEKMKAFTAFAKTREGQKFLAKYAHEGETIAGITFKKSGELDAKGMDLTYKSENKAGENGGGNTHTDIQYDKKGNPVGTNTVITLFEGNGWKTSSKLFNQVSTIVHESFIHVQGDAEDYLDNKKLDDSNISAKDKNDAFGFSVNYQHAHEGNQYINGKPTLFNTAGYSVLIKVASENNIKLSGYEVMKAMWNFNGSKVNLIPSNKKQN